MSNKKPHLKKAVIVRHRKNKNLCLRCGLDITDNCIALTCIENYDKTDNRVVEKEKQIITESERKRNTILYYRKEKMLCLKCGKELHEGDCVENFERSDNRPDTDKQYRPAIIKTPKTEKSFIIDTINSNNKPLILLSKTEDLYLPRPTLMISLEKSSNGNIIEYSCINQLSKKFQDHILLLIGNAEKYFAYSDFLKMKKLINIIHAGTPSKQVCINYLYAVKKYFSYENEYVDYCRRNKLNYYQFPNNRNATNVLNLSAYTL